MNRKVIRTLIVLLVIIVGFNLAFSSNTLAVTNNKSEAVLDDTNQIKGNLKANIKVPRSTAAISSENFTRDISASTDLTSLKAWINGSLVYEKGKTASFPDSIYEGMSFKTALNWKFKDTLPMPLSDGDYFTIKIGKITNLNFEAEKKEMLYIDRIAVGSSYFRYIGDELTYTIAFNSNIAYFENIQGEFIANGTFKGINNGDKVNMEFDTGGKGEIIVVEKPAATDPSGNVGIGIPDIKPVIKELITIGKSTYAEDMNVGVFGWRVAFTDLLHKNQSNLTNITNPEYEDLIIEDVLDENQIFVDEVEYGYNAPFFLDIPLMLPGTQNAVAYSGSDLTEKVSQVSAQGNGNSDYIIKPRNFTKLTSEADVRSTPVSWAIVEDDNRQKLIINLGKLGTTNKTDGITSDMIEARYPERNPKPYTDIDGVIDTELKKYNDVLNHKNSPYYNIQKKFTAFKGLYDSSISGLSDYITSFDNYIASNTESSEPTRNPPTIPEVLKLASVVDNEVYKEFNKAIDEYKTVMAKYVEKMTDGNPYKENLKEIVQGLQDAKPYFQQQDNRLYGFCLKYKTQITNGSTGVVSNQAKITTGQKSYDADSEAKHTYRSGISGVFAKGDIVVMKAEDIYNYDDTILSTGKDLQGMKNVKFEVYDEGSDKKLYFFNKSLNENGAYQYYGLNNAGKDFTSVVETDENGKFVLSGLTPNKKYYLKEVSVLEGYYESQNQKVSFTVDVSKVNYKLVENVARTVTLKKIDKNAELSGTSSSLAGATFELYNDKNQRIEYFKKDVIAGKTYFTYTHQATDNEKLITQTDGILTIKNLPSGNYYIKEVAAPSGYILSDEKHSFTLTKNENVSHKVIDLGNIYNLKNDASITIKKVDEKISTPLMNTAFELYKAPDGLSWSQGNHNDWQLITASQFNQANQYITSQKMDGNTLLTNENGEISISALPKGNYYLKEVKAVDGYVLNQKHYHFTIENSTKESQLFASQTIDETLVDKVDNNLITNKRGTGSIEIIKYDRFQGASVTINGISQNLNKVFYDNGNTRITIKKPLMGVIFDLYKQDGDYVNVKSDTKIKTGLMTDEEGKIKVNDLEVGTYYFIEVSTLDHYQLKQEPIAFEITHQDVQNDSKTLIRLVDNYQFEYKVILNKQDKQTRVKLEGAHFELYDSTNKVMKFKYNEQKKIYVYDENGSPSLITNEDGQIIIDGLTPQQKYFFKEIKAPKGYRIDMEYNLYEVHINKADELIVINEPIITEIICTNEKITISDISQGDEPQDNQSSERDKKPTTSDITNFGFGTLLLSGCVAVIAYKRKKKHFDRF